MPHSNRCTARYLSLIMDANRWSELILAKRTGIAQTTVSNHLSGHRQILGHHLAAYLNAVELTQRNELLAAWLEDRGVDSRAIVKPRNKRQRLGGLLLVPWLYLIDWLAWR